MIPRGDNRRCKNLAPHFTLSALSPQPCFFRRQRLQRQRMDRAAHQIAQRRVDQAVTRQRQLAGERRGDDGGLEMHAVGAAARRPWRRAGRVRSES